MKIELQDPEEKTIYSKKIDNFPMRDGALPDVVVHKDKAYQLSSYWVDSLRNPKKQKDAGFAVYVECFAVTIA